MEDWQEWQIRADQVAAALNKDVDSLQEELEALGDGDIRPFWRRYRDIKERVRVAPAIKLEDKLDLERRLRTVGSRAYKAQEAINQRSGERKEDLISAIAALRAQTDGADSPRRLRELRRELDQIRGQFEEGAVLVPADRQAVWEAWREANQLVWQNLNGLWGQSEDRLRALLTAAQQQLEAGNSNAARQSVGRFFESLRRYEAKQSSVNAMKADAERIRDEAAQLEERRSAERTQQVAPAVSPLEAWKSEIERNGEAVARLEDEIAALEQGIRESSSLLEQAMIRGNLVDKRRKLDELERSNRTLQQRVDQAQAEPVLPAG